MGIPNNEMPCNETAFNGSSLLFFFLILVVLFCNCGLFDECGDSLLFFFLLLVIILCNFCFDN